MTIKTYTTWAKHTGVSCVSPCHRTSAGHRLFRYDKPLTRHDVLTSAGFRQVSGGALLDCTRLTEERSVQLTPAEAVKEFLKESAHEYSDVIYYRDPEDYWGVIVWAKD
jgi:hypothetical protein